MLRPEEALALPLTNGAVVALGDDGLIAYCNPAALALLGWSSNLQGKSLSAVVPQRLQDKHHDAFAHFSTVRHPTTTYPRIQPALGEDGKERNVQIAIVAYRRPDSSIFLCSALARPGAPWPSLEATHTELIAHGYTVIEPKGEVLRIVVTGGRA